MKSIPIFLSVLIALLINSQAHSAEPKAKPAPNFYSVRGVVKQIAADHRKAVIKHEAIPDYMPAMIMELTLRDPKELDGIKVGDTILFRLVANEEDHWIDTLRRIETTSAKESEIPATGKSVDLKPSAVLPDATFLGENGEPVRLSQFRGQAVAFTFIFTRCPLPDFCPFLGRAFVKSRSLLRADATGPTNWQFLSISFDPEFDQPPVLKRYAEQYRGSDPANWRFASASTNTLAELMPRLNLMVYKEGASLFHNLRTVVLDTCGRIYRQFDGNEWTAADLASAIREASRTATNTGTRP